MRAPRPEARAAATAVVLLIAAATAAGLAAPASGAPADESPGATAGFRVERLSGDTVVGTRLTALDSKRLTIETPAGPVSVPLDDVIEVATSAAPDPVRPWAPFEVAADLWTGETVFGEIRGGDAEGIDIDTALLGKVRIPLEQLASLRFLHRLSQAAEPPDLRPRKDADVVHLVGADQFTGTIEGFTAKSLKSQSAKGDRMDVPFEKLVAVCLLADPNRKSPALDGALRLALRDGTRVVGREPSLTNGRLRMKSPSGIPVDCLAADVVAIQAAGSRFSFLSDIPAAETKVKPLWEVAAGDPAVLFAPQFDRSFSGKPLRCGGRTWLDGIGVFSGTSLTWNLDGAWEEFRATVGLDDGAGPLGGVVFEVFVDGKEAWSSGFVRPAPGTGTATARGQASPVTTPRIPLAGAKTLTLVVLAGDDEDPYPVQDEADWLGAIVVRAKK